MEALEFYKKERENLFPKGYESWTVGQKDAHGKAIKKRLNEIDKKIKKLS